MNRLPIVAAVTVLTATVPAQINLANDVGLTLAGGLLPVIYGQECGPFTCVPLPSAPISRGQSRTLTHDGAPNTPYVIAIGLPATGCLQVNGIDNALMLSAPIITLTIGVTSALIPGGQCGQGSGSYVLTVPASTPLGLAFNMQSLGTRPSNGHLAFSPAITSVVVL
jgi:hypothetical protein